MAKRGLCLEEIIHDVETNQYSVRLSFAKGAERGQLVVPRGDATSNTILQRKLLDAGATLSKRDARDVKDLAADIKQGPFPNSKNRTMQSGWTPEHSYLRPGRVLGRRRGTYILRSDDPLDHDQCRGELKTWIRGLRGPCQKSSYLRFGIGVAFGAVFLKLAGENEGAAINFQGETSQGKTLLLRGCQSVFTCAADNDLADFDETWASMEQVMASRNDLVVCFDDLATMRNISKRREKLRFFAHKVAKGRGKGRDRAYERGKETIRLRWRVFVLTTSELSLDEHGRSGGERARYIELGLPGEAKNGIFDLVKGRDKKKESARLAKQVHETLSAAFGVALEAFINGLFSLDRKSTIAEIKKIRDQFVAAVVGDEGSPFQRRIAKKFGIILAGMLFAARLRCAPWTKNGAEKAVKRMYRAACASNSEDRVLAWLGKQLRDNKLPVLKKGAEIPSSSVGFERKTKEVGRIFAINPQAFEEGAGGKLAAEAAYDFLNHEGIAIKDGAGKRHVQLAQGNERRRFVVLLPHKLAAALKKSNATEK